MPRNASNPRILITRLSAIGDCVHTMPLVCAIKRACPGAFIAWAVEPAAAPLVEGHEAVDQVVVVPKGWLKSLATIRSVRRQLRALKCDTSLDPQSLSKSCMLGWFSGARRRIGFAKGQGRELAPWLNNTCISPRASHVVDKYLEVARPLGITSLTVEFCMKHDPLAKHTIERYLADAGVDRPFAMINPGAGWDSKLWPLERYAHVAQHVGETHKRPSVVVWAGNRERLWAEQIVTSSSGHAHLAPPTSLLELTELCRLSGLFVGSDTGPLHIAAAVGTQCVGMYGPTSPAVCGPYGTGHVIVQTDRPTDASRMRDPTNDVMHSISAEQVADACDRVLAGNATNKTHAA